MGLLETIFSAAFEKQKLDPITGISTRYKNWISVKDLRRCLPCHDMHGKIWMLAEETPLDPSLHPYCRCKIVKVTTIQAGTATINGTNGADWKLKYKGSLPEYYITLKEAYGLGWKRGKNFSSRQTE